MKTFAPELKALIIIFRSTGPVISTHRFCRSGGVGATIHSLSRTFFVSGRKSGIFPASKSFCRSARRASSFSRVGLNCRWSLATKSRASSVRMAADAGSFLPITRIPCSNLTLRLRESPSPRVSGERVAEGRVRGTSNRRSSAASRHLLPTIGEKGLDEPYFTAPVVMPETK